jgi:subtilisin family serine protease
MLARRTPPSLSVVPGVERLRDIPARAIDVPRDPRAWDLSASALEAQLAAGEWHATVAFKVPTSVRLASSETGKGVRQAVTVDAIEDGLELLVSQGVEILSVNALIGGAHVVFPRGVGQELWGHELIDYIEPAHVRYRVGGPTAPMLLPARTGEVTPIGADIVRASQVWGSYTGYGVKVGTIDNGYDTSHDDLYAISSSHCWDGDSEDCEEGWHGTFVAGVLAAQDNDEGVIGVAPGIGADFYWCDLGNTNTDVTACIGRMVDTWGVQIINMSFGGSFSQDVSTAVAYAYEVEVEDAALLVSIANNRDSATTSTPPSAMYPASHVDYVIGVSGVMPDSSFASGPQGLCTYTAYDSIFAEWGNASNYGSYVELAAPFYTVSTAVTSMDQEYEYGPSEGWHLLEVRVWDDVTSAWDFLWVEVDSGYSC